MTFAAFAALYCETQDCTPEQLRKVLKAQRANYSPKGWMLLECHMLDGSRLGERTILPFGPANTYREVPKHPVSPRGLASDMSVVIAVLPAEAI